MSLATHGTIEATISTRSARLLQRARRFLWQRDRFTIYRFERAVSSILPPETDAMEWIGINDLARDTDSPFPSALSANGEGMRTRGDSGLLAWSADGQLMAWVWVRSGAYTERAGCGYLKIPRGVRVVFEFKVRPDLRGRGIGRLILGELARRLDDGRRTPHDCTTISIVAPKNTASRRAFEQAGFVRAGVAETRRIGGVRLTRALPELRDGDATRG
jgi:L-amino acid N-acyltransferase YncA